MSALRDRLVAELGARVWDLARALGWGHLLATGKTEMVVRARRGEDGLELQLFFAPRLEIPALPWPPWQPRRWSLKLALEEQGRRS